MNPSLMFEAGRLAAERNWVSPSMITVDQVPELGPTGEPVVVVAGADTVDAAAARAVAAVAGAGREIIVVTDGELSPQVHGWLPAGLVHIAGSAITIAPDDASVTDGVDQSPVTGRGAEKASDVDAAQDWTGPTVEEPSVDETEVVGGSDGEDTVWVCPFDSATVLESLQPAMSGWVAAAWNQFVAQRQLTVMDQGNGDGVCAGGWRLDDQLPAALWFQPTQSIRTGEEFLLIGSTVAVAGDPATPIVLPGSWWQQGFADQVVSWCEQPEVSAMVNRVFAFGQPARPLGRRYGPDECFPDLPEGMVNRVLVVEDGQQMLVVPVAGEPRWVDNGPGSRSITFIYRLTAIPDYEKLDLTWAHAIDSLVRIQRLLTHPDSDLDGRRDPALAPSLRAFLEGSAVTAAGTVAGNLRDTLMDPDLPRQAHVMSQVWVSTNGEPGWQEFRQFGEVGLKAAFRYIHANPDLLTGEQLRSIGDVYRDLCAGFQIDATHPWTSFDEMLQTVNARNTAHHPATCPVCGTATSPGDLFCGSCGQSL